MKGCLKSSQDKKHGYHDKENNRRISKETEYIYFKYFICHKGSIANKNIACKGYFDYFMNKLFNNG